MKGQKYISLQQKKLSRHELDLAKDLTYNKSTLAIETQLDQNQTETIPPWEKYDSYEVCRSLAFSKEELETSFQLNGGELTNIVFIQNL